MVSSLRVTTIAALLCSTPLQATGLVAVHGSLPRRCVGWCDRFSWPGRTCTFGSTSLVISRDALRIPWGRPKRPGIEPRFGTSMSDVSSPSWPSASPLFPEFTQGLKPLLPPKRRCLSSPGESLNNGEWFKLICGASFEDLPLVRNLAMVYTLAGVDCVDVAAEDAVVEAARWDGIDSARTLASKMGVGIHAPWLMVSVNDDEEDPHFRKAYFNPALCPPDCPRPCETVCPAEAVVFPDSPSPPAQRKDMVAQHLTEMPRGGVLGVRCYGCGRCIDVCPLGIIDAKKYVRSHNSVRSLLEKVEAQGNLKHFQDLWGSIGDVALSRLRAVAVSFPDLGENTGLAVATMDATIRGGGKWGQGRPRPLNIWQTDGRPMSGDIGKGATTACIRLASKVLSTKAVPFGDGQHFIQLAGGTNNWTAPKLREAGML
ncbi:unnamed protein product, partial [Discosporangium mesarthrocarpum]